MTVSIAQPVNQIRLDTKQQSKPSFEIKIDNLDAILDNEDEDYHITIESNIDRFFKPSVFLKFKDN